MRRVGDYHFPAHAHIPTPAPAHARTHAHRARAHKGAREQEQEVTSATCAEVPETVTLVSPKAAPLPPPSFCTLTRAPLSSCVIARVLGEGRKSGAREHGSGFRV
jgi:hypothetical protein